MSSCPTCEAPITREDRFCGNCGAALTSFLPYEEPSAAIHAAGEGSEEGAAAPAQDKSRPSRQIADESDSMEDDPSSSGQFERAPAGAGESLDEPDTDEDALDPRFQPTIINAPRSSSGSVALENTSGESEEASGSGFPGPHDTTEPQSTAVDAPSLDPSTPDEIKPVEKTKPSFDSSDTGERRPTSDELEPRRYTGDPSPRTAGVGSSSGARHKGAVQLEPGTLLIGRYEIVRKIGGGGMGAVYYAKDRNLGDAPRAVKEMVQSQLDESQHEKAVNDFKRESMLLASLEHPSIPTIYDYFFDEGSSRFYLVMKYISGGDFLARLRNAPGSRIDEMTVVDWGIQVADVLDYLHNRRPPIIYRDLKPANLMIDGNTGRVMLIDFGIARWVAPQEKGVTAVGTMGYAPPELFSGRVEARSDVYSLGATMFHLLTGADPQDNPLLIFDFNKFPRPRQINPGLSNEIERILMRAVEYTPETRFRSAAEIRDMLMQHIEKLRAGAVTYGGIAYAEPHDAKTVGVEMVYCGFCGGRIAAEDGFCAHCGARQPISAAAAARAARATAKLVVAGTTELEATFQLQKDSSLVGRTDPQSNIFPDFDLSKFDPETKISRRHARIWRKGDTFLVEDLGSVNGTVINDSIKLGPRQPRTLEHGDRIRLGETTLHFLVG
jgi:serine/threonine-protein kinase